MRAETIARALRGHKTGANWKARCPAHDDRTPSLSISDAQGSTVLVHWHTGCNQESVIAALRTRGLWETSERRPLFTRRSPLASKSDSASSGIKLALELARLGVWVASVDRVLRVSLMDPKYATTNEDQLQKFWQMWPRAIVGLSNASAPPAGANHVMRLAMANLEAGRPVLTGTNNMGRRP